MARSPISPSSSTPTSSPRRSAPWRREHRGNDMIHYVGILDGSRRTWGVRFPDLPGCHGGGATPEAAIADAVSALAEFAAELQRRYAIAQSTHAQGHRERCP